MLELHQSAKLLEDGSVIVPLRFMSSRSQPHRGTAHGGRIRKPALVPEGNHVSGADAYPGSRTACVTVLAHILVQPRRTPLVRGEAGGYSGTRRARLLENAPLEVATGVGLSHRYDVSAGWWVKSL
jgi:hypothetical protein